MLIRPKAEHLIHRQPPRNLMRDEDHRHLPLQPVDRPGEVFRRLLIKVRHHSFIVNVAHVKGYSNQGEIQLADGLKCALSSVNKQTFIGLFKKHS